MKSFVAYLLAFALTVSVAGCGGPGSAPGDDNDPEASDDTEQMQEESGTEEGEEDESEGDESGGAGAV